MNISTPRATHFVEPRIVVAHGCFSPGKKEHGNGAKVEPISSPAHGLLKLFMTVLVTRVGF